MSPERLSYALAKQVPDMLRGFVILTDCGDIVIEPGPMADRLTSQVRDALITQRIVNEELK